MTMAVLPVKSKVSMVCGGWVGLLEADAVEGWLGEGWEGVGQRLADAFGVVVGDDGEEGGAAAGDVDGEGAGVEEALAHEVEEGEFAEEGVFEVIAAEGGEGLG